MANLSNKLLFFTTSPRTPSKMIPEIKLLCECFSGLEWNKQTQEEFMDSLALCDFFEGNGAPSDKSFSARDRINRAPKALGFVDLTPKIKLTDAGKEFIYGKRPQEVFLRQLLKFQLPSPYHIESQDVRGTFCVRPYLELLRLIRDLEYLTFDEFKIFAVQLTNYNKYEVVKNKILQFRNDVKDHRGQYKLFVDVTWENAVKDIFRDRITKGKTKTRETLDNSIKKFIKTQKSNMRDYADAGFRYLRYSGLVAIENKNRSISIFQDKTVEVDFILKNVDREPVFINNEAKYKQYLFEANKPILYTDNKDNILDLIVILGSFDRKDLINKSVDELKDLRDDIVSKHKDAILREKIDEIKSYTLYSEIIDTYNGIVHNDYYDTPLMLEYNTWRAMTMLDGGTIKGNLTFDDNGGPLSTAAGNMPDIECNYDDFSLSVEVTMQSGQRQYESEGEPVARHYGQLKNRVQKETYCLFIAPCINVATLALFYGLNHINIASYGGKSKIIPLDLNQFVRLVENSYNYPSHPIPNDVKKFLDEVITECNEADDENDWKNRIQNCVDNWLVA